LQYLETHQRKADKVQEYWKKRNCKNRREHKAAKENLLIMLGGVDDCGH
jgi:hypothetical protein